jgi:transaldolase/glucose-6-phosphate isomerase
VGSGIPADEDPALTLGAALGYFSSIGRDKVTFFLSEDISSFGLWVEQLLAESTGKGGKGLVPITGEPVGVPDDYGPDRVFVSITLGPMDKGLDDGLKALKEAGHPVMRFCLKDPYELGGEFLRWEVATAAAGVIMGINPFDQPDVELAKSLTRARLEKSADTTRQETPGVEFKDGPLSVYFNGSASRRLEGPIQEGSLLAALKGLFASVGEGDYLGLLAYFNPFDAHAKEALQGVRSLLFTSGKAATQFGYGPRYLHSTGQLHKGGAGNGVFLILTHGAADDIKIPGSPFSFSELEISQAFADMEALDTRGRPVVLFNLKDPAAGSLKQLHALIRGALS